MEDGEEKGGGFRKYVVEIPAEVLMTFAVYATSREDAIKRVQEDGLGSLMYAVYNQDTAGKPTCEVYNKSLVLDPNFEKLIPERKIV